MSSPSHQFISEMTASETTMAAPTAPELVVSAPQTRFNYNKLQAVACMALSAAVSIGLIIWAVKSFGWD